MAAMTRRTRSVFHKDRLEALGGLDDSPDVFGSVAELAACYTGAEIEVADTDGVILDRVCKVVVALCHGSDEYGDTLLVV